VLTLSFYLLTAAVLLGLVLALFYVGFLPRRSWIAGAVHGGLAAAGLIALVLSLGGPPRGVEYGVQSFGLIAAIVASIALLIGLGVVGLQFFRQRTVSGLVGLHVTVGLGAYFFLMAYVLIG